MRSRCPTLWVIATMFYINHAMPIAMAAHQHHHALPENMSAPVAGVGLIVVDVRANKKVGNGEGYVMSWFESMQFTAPLLPIELWVGQTTLLDERIQLHIDQRSDFITVRRMPLVNTENDVPRGFDLNTGNGGHIGKAYALSHSAFDVAVLTDTDVYACDGWTKKLYQTLNMNPSAEVIWTFANHANPDDLDNGSVQSKEDADKRFNHVSKEIDSQKEEYGEFRERNTGTVVVVRKTDQTKAFLDDVLIIYTKLEEAGLTHSGDIKKFIGTAGEKIGHDQGAFREAMFLHRDKITEVVMPAGKEAFKRQAWACRPAAHRIMKGKFCGRCGNPCLLVHSKPCVTHLIHRYGSSYGGVDHHIPRNMRNKSLTYDSEGVEVKAV